MAIPLTCLYPILFVVFLVLLRIFRKKPRLPPGPWPIPFVGNLYAMTPLRFRCFWNWSKIYGPIISVWTGSTLNVVLSSSDLAKEALKDRDQQLAARSRTRAADLFSSGGQDLIWADYGPHYVKVRKVCTLELFAPKRLEILRPLREDEVAAMVESIFNGCGGKDGGTKVVTLRTHLAAVAFNNITRIAFGKRFVDVEGNIDPQGMEFKDIIAQGMKLGLSVKTSEFIPWIRWMFPLQKEEFIKHGERRENLTKSIMQERASASEGMGESKQHFIDALLMLRNQHDLTDTHIIGLLWDMITAGMDTTAISVEWAMAELVRHPRVQQKAQIELDHVVGMGNVVKEADFAKLPYLQCIVKESLRLHPPTPLMLPHKATEDVKIGGYDVPKGTVVHVNVWAIARDPAIWKDPLMFRPERFLEEDVDIKGHDYRLLPFGAGRRVCPGAQLALNLVQLMLARLLHQFSWSPVEGMKPDEIDMSERPGVVTFMAKPLQALAQPRLPAASPHLYSRSSSTV